MKNNKVWMNGKIVSAKDAKISVFDGGLLYGDGIFETIRVYDGVPFRLSDHLSRLFDSAKVIKLKIPVSIKKFGPAIQKLLAANGLTEAYIRITVTRGENVIIVAREFKGYPAKSYSDGISTQISKIKQDAASPLSRIKSLNFLPHMLAKRSAQDDGFDDAILLNTDMNVAEAATSNIFIVKRGCLITPSLDSGILPGITRSVIIEVARQLRMAVSEKTVSVKELLAADEIFFTNSLAEVLPVVKVGRRAMSGGRPGEFTKLFHAAYHAKVQR